MTSQRFFSYRGLHQPSQLAPYVWLFDNRPSTDALIIDSASVSYLSRTSVYVMYSPTVAGHVLPTSWNPTVIAQFGDETQIPNGTTIPNSTLGPFTQIMYDCENWANTPSNQQSSWSGSPQPVNAYNSLAQQASATAGCPYFAAPGLDLNTVIFGGVNKYTAAINNNLIGAWAINSNWVCIQSQQIVGGDTSGGSSYTFATWVPLAVTQAKAANPNVKIIIGIGTQDVNANPYTLSQLQSAISSVATLPVNGFWFNNPGGTGSALVVSTIQWMASLGGR